MRVAKKCTQKEMHSERNAFRSPGQGRTWRFDCRAILDNTFRKSRRIGLQRMENYFNLCVQLYKGENMVQELQMGEI